MNVLVAIEQSAFSTWVRESPSVWAYPTILFLHTVGLGLLVGASMVIDLRMLGFSPAMPLEPMKKFFPVMWLGLWVNALSGVVLVMIDASKIGESAVLHQDGIHCACPRVRAADRKASLRRSTQ
jgi:hypothetical protein